MTARDDVLSRIRNANVAAARPSKVVRAYRRAGQGTARDLIGQFAQRAADYRATVTRASPDAMADAVTVALTASGARHVLVPSGYPYPPPDVAVREDEPVLSATDLDQIDGVLTTCAVAIAETGTIVLDCSAGQGRRIVTLIPDLHVVVVRASQIVRGVPEALARLDPARPLTWISGPSATSDIELNRIEGVHGPRQLHLVIVLGR